MGDGTTPTSRHPWNRHLDDTERTGQHYECELCNIDGYGSYHRLYDGTALDDR